MRIKHTALALSLACAVFCAGCQDELSSQGGSLVDGEIAITVDSISTDISASVVTRNAFDSRSITKLLGHLDVPEYGSLDCSFMAAMYPQPTLNIPDSITSEEIDSLRIVMFVPRGSLTGDSLSPQQLKAYRLHTPLPTDVTNAVDPADYYSESDLIGSTTYTLSALNLSDTLFKKETNIKMRIPLPRESALELFNAYRNDPSVFEWPQNLVTKFPGVYVKRSFGNGCIANISKLSFYLYYRTQQPEYVKNEETDSTELRTIIKRDSVCLMTSSPEVVSTNVIRYDYSDKLKQMVAGGDKLITTPGGYTVDIDFPAKDIIDRYNRNHSQLTVISSLSLTIPADVIENDYGIGAPPSLLMVKTSELADFFENNKLPDSKTSFTADYDKKNKCYSFPSLREYILDLIKSGKEPAKEDMEFTLVPVRIVTETVDNYGSQTTYITRCSNYIAKPTMVQLHLDRAIIKFIYSKQTLE